MMIAIEALARKKEEPEGWSGSTILTVREGDLLARRCRGHHNRFGFAAIC